MRIRKNKRGFSTNFQRFFQQNNTFNKLFQNNIFHSLALNDIREICSQNPMTGLSSKE